MIKITNGISTLEVTKGAYNTIYKPMGFQSLEELNNAEIEITEDEVLDEENLSDAVNEDEEVKETGKNDLVKNSRIEELKAKPISGWSKQEVKEYAKLANVDLTGTKSVDEAKAVIAKTL